MECRQRRLAHHRRHSGFTCGRAVFLAYGSQDGSFGFDFAGTYTQIIPHKLIEYSFGERNACVQFSADAQGVLVSVEFDAEETHSIEQQREGWQAILENFARHVLTHKMSNCRANILIFDLNY